jgi:hypothetical protein
LGKNQKTIGLTFPTFNENVVSSGSRKRGT